MNSIFNGDCIMKILSILLPVFWICLSTIDAQDSGIRLPAVNEYAKKIGNTPTRQSPPSVKETAKEWGIEGEITDQHDFPYLNYLKRLTTSKFAPKKTVRILSIDGGGVRGIIPAIVIAEIEKQLGMPITKVFHGFVGTSAGGILTLALNKPAPKTDPQLPSQTFSASQVVELTEEMIKTVFPKKAGIAKILTSQSFHSAKPIEEFLLKKFGDTALRDSIRPVCISTFEIITENNVMLCTPMGIHNVQNDLSMRTVARATSAAPFYFPTLQVKINNTPLLLTDGGVGANNPALHALTEMRKIYGDKKQYNIVALGTGIAKSGFQIENLTKGSGLKMLKPTIAGLFKAQDDITNDLMKELSRGEGFKYTRLQTFLTPEGNVLDDSSPKTIALLKEAGQKIIQGPQFKKMMEDLKKELSEEQISNPVPPQQNKPVLSSQNRPIPPLPNKRAAVLPGKKL